MILYKNRYIRVNNDSLIYVMLFGLLAIQIGLPLKYYVLVSVGTWSVLIGTVLAFIFRAKSGVDINMLTVIAISSMVVVSMLCSFTVSYQGFVASLSFLEIPILISAYPNVCERKKIRKTIYICFILLALFYIGISFTSLSNIYYNDYGEKQVPFLTLGYKNPNQTSMYLVTCFIILICLMLETRKIKFKILSGVLAITMLYLIVQTLSRTGLLVCIIFVLLTFCLRKTGIPLILHLIAFALPIMFFVITLIWSDALQTLSILGEDFETGRLEIYRDFLNELTPIRFLIGWHPMHFTNLHNAILTIFATTGIFCTGSYVFFLYKKLQFLLQFINSRRIGKNALIGLYCIMIYMSVESAFLVSGGAFAVMFFSLYILCVTE